MEKTKKKTIEQSGVRKGSPMEGVGVKEWCALENRVRVRSMSLEMAPFDRSHTSSYSPSIVTMAIFCIVCEI